MLDVYTDPEYTRNIWIVAPAYFLAFRIFEDAGLGVGGKMRAVAEDEEGVDIEVLKREIWRSEEEAKRREGKEGARPRYKPERKRAKVYKHVIYCVPTFANPSSRTMSLDRRKELVRLAREFDALVVCDDVYDFLQWPADGAARTREQASNGSAIGLRMDDMVKAHLPRIVDIDREIDGGAEREGADRFGNACSNGSFSKIAGPGIRVGWLEGTEKFAYGVSQTWVFSFPVFQYKFRSLIFLSRSGEGNNVTMLALHSPTSNELRMKSPGYPILRIYSNLKSRTNTFAHPAARPAPAAPQAN